MSDEIQQNISRLAFRHGITLGHLNETGGRELECVLERFDAQADEITRLREQLHLANIDAVGAHAEANELRDHLSKVVALTIRHIDTQQCSVSDLRTLIAARSALDEAKP